MDEPGKKRCRRRMKQHRLAITPAVQPREEAWRKIEQGCCTEHGMNMSPERKGAEEEAWSNSGR